jgi:hypothetical protein
MGDMETSIYKYTRKRPVEVTGKLKISVQGPIFCMVSDSRESYSS